MESLPSAASATVCGLHQKQFTVLSASSATPHTLPRKYIVLNMDVHKLSLTPSRKRGIVLEMPVSGKNKHSDAS
jgi:hypothetical protein